MPTPGKRPADPTTTASPGKTYRPLSIFGKMPHARLSRAHQRHAVPAERSAGDRAICRSSRLCQRDPRPGGGGAERGGGSEEGSVGKGGGDTSISWVGPYNEKKKKEKK